MKELSQSKVDIVARTGCSCCCKRNPPGIPVYEGIWAGNVDSEDTCINICGKRKDSLGFMSCIDDSEGEFGCSTYNNTKLTEVISYHHKKYRHTWAKEALKILSTHRASNAN